MWNLLDKINWIVKFKLLKIKKEFELHIAITCWSMMNFWNANTFTRLFYSTCSIDLRFSFLTIFFIELIRFYWIDKILIKERSRILMWFEFTIKSFNLIINKISKVKTHSSSQTLEKNSSIVLIMFDLQRWRDDTDDNMSKNIEKSTIIQCSIL